LIWLCGGESRRNRAAFFACLMAEYASDRRCVRAAAGGFSPAMRRVMPRAKARRALVFHIMLESGARFFEQKAAPPWKTMPQENGWQRCQRQ